MLPEYLIRLIVHCEDSESAYRQKDYHRAGTALTQALDVLYQIATMQHFNLSLIQAQVKQLTTYDNPEVEQKIIISHYQRLHEHIRKACKLLQSESADAEPRLRLVAWTMTLIRVAAKLPLDMTNGS